MIQYDHHLKVYYKDIDQMGIVYYSRYLEYFEEARTELLASIGLDVTSVEKKRYPTSSYYKSLRLSSRCRIGAEFDHQDHYL